MSCPENTSLAEEFITDTRDSLADHETRLDAIDSRLEDLPEEDTGRAINDRFDSIEEKITLSHINHKTFSEDVKRILSGHTNIQEALVRDIEEVRDDIEEVRDSTSNRISELEAQIFSLREALLQQMLIHCDCYEEGHKEKMLALTQRVQNSSFSKKQKKNT
jgi:hypothetical protein